MYVSLMRQIRLKDYREKISVTWGRTGEIILGFTIMNTLLTTRRISKAVETLGDLIELARYRAFAPGKLNAVVGQERVALVRHGLEQGGRCPYHLI